MDKEKNKKFENRWLKKEKDAQNLNQIFYYLRSSVTNRIFIFSCVYFHLFTAILAL